MTSDAKKTKAELIKELNHLREIVRQDPTRRLFDKAPLPYHCLDEEARLVAVNQAWLDLSGYREDEVLGHWLGEFLAPESRARLERTYADFLKQGKVSNLERVYIKQDGTRIVVSLDSRLEHTPDGPRAHAILHDITEMRRAREDLAASERRFRGLFESNADGIIYTNADGSILNVNPALCQMLGREEGELLGKHVGDITPEDDREGRKAFYWEQPLADASSANYRHKFIHADGHLVQTSLRVWPDLDEEGAPMGAWGLVRDMTEAIATEERAARTKELYRLLAENTEDVIWTVDNDLNYTYVSPAVYELRGVHPEDLIGRNSLEFMTSGSSSRISKQYWKLIAAEAEGKNAEPELIEAELTTPDGSTVWVEVQARVLRDQRGKRIGFLGSTRDISARKQMELRLMDSERSLRAMLEATDDAVGLFSRDGQILDINHNMETLLHTDSGKGDKVAACLPPEVGEKWVDAIDQTVRTGGAASIRTVQGGRILDTAVYPVRDETGHVSKVAAFAKDVTESIQAEEALRQSEAQYRRIVETANEGIVGLDATQRVTFVNQRTAEFLGYPLEETLGRRVADFVPPEDRGLQGDRFRRREKGEHERYECRFVRKDGKVVWGLVSAAPISGESGEFLGVFAMIADISESKRAEARLRESEARYRHIFESTVEGLYQSTPDGRFISVNPSMAAILGYESPEQVVENITDIPSQIYADPERRDEMKRLLHEQGAVHDFEIRFCRRDGKLIWISMNAQAVYDEEGNPVRYEGSLVDISERKRTGEALRRSQALLNEVQRVSRTGGWEIDRVSGEVQWTEGQYRLFGRPLSEPPPSQLEEFLDTYVHPDDREEFWEKMQTVVRDNVPVKMEYRQLRTDGNEAILVGMAIPETDETGKVIRLFGSTRDVTMERQAARDLQQSHERLLTILDGMDADIYVSGMESHEVLFMNAHMRESFGTPAKDMPCHEFLRNEPEQCPYCAKSRLLDENGAPVETIVSEWFNPSTKRWYLNHDRAIQWLEGEMVHMHMAADITDIKTMSENLRVAMAEAETANMAKNEFLANMSHEIRTPLNGLLGMLQLLQHTSLVGEQRECLTTAMNSGRGLLQILNDILDLSKVESGKLELEESEFELGELLDSVISVFQHQVETRGLEIAWRIDPDLPRHFIADKGRLRQILFNLVGNASKFTESGRITAEAYPLSRPAPDGRVRLLFMVSDTGIGIPDDKVSAVFDPFTQVDGSSTRKYQGTGLGLGIVRRLVTLMGGSLSVASDEGEGTTVIFTLLAENAEQAETPPPLPGANDDNVKFSILVAEDERVNRTVVERLLNKLGHEAECVETGEMALNILRERSFDCILMDIQMPGLDGMETTRFIREELGLDVPVIALTAHAMKGDRDRFLEAGMNGYVSKPFDLAQLEAELQRVVNRSGS